MSSIRARGALRGARWAVAIASLMAVAACGGTSGEEAEAAPIGSKPRPGSTATATAE